MKNRFSKLIITVAAILLTQGCAKDYLDTIPTSSVSKETVFTTTQNAWAAINGIHRLMYMQWRDQGEVGQGSMMIHVDYLGEDMAMTAAGSGWYNNTHRWLAHTNSNSSIPNFAWYFYYRIINNANIVIESIDNAVGTQSEKDHIKGQALAYRAWAHFNLVQLFGKRYDWTAKPNNQLGVPIMTKSTTEPQPRKSVEEVYKQVNDDLDLAITLLDGKPAKLKSHINVRVARGIKARVALTTGEWATAFAMANQARTGLTLMSAAQLLEGFTKIANPEFMWACEVIADQTTYFYSYYAYNSYNFSSSMIRANPKKINNLLYNLMSTTDRRRQLWEPTTTAARTRLTAEGIPTTFAVTTHHNFKFKAVDQGDSRGDLPYMRVAEMILIEAEAYARRAQAGDEVLARQRLFELMSNRDPSYVLSTNSGTALINEIMNHRRIELWGEGFRFYDLKRLNLALNRNGANHTASLAVIYDVPAGDNRWQWLIPEDEMKANPLMEQNP